MIVSDLVSGRLSASGRFFVGLLAILSVETWVFGLEIDQEKPQRPDLRILPLPIANPIQDNPSYAALAVQTDIECRDSSLESILEQLSLENSVAIRIDQAEPNLATSSSDVVITLTAKQLPLRQILNRIVIQTDFDWFVDDQGVVMTTRNAAAKRLQELLKFELQIIDTLCELTDAQSQKLQLSARHDLHRILNRIQECQAIIERSANDKNKIHKVNETLLEIEKLHKSIEMDPFGKDSFYRKSLMVILTRPQLEQYQPIAAVLEKGGTVATAQRDSKTFLSVRLTQLPFTDNDLAQLKSLSILGSLRLELTKVTDAGAVHLCEMKNLRELNVVATKMTDAGLAQLKGMTNLESLVLCSTGVTDEGMPILNGLTHLRDLNLNYLKISNAGLRQLRDLTKLQSLGLAYTKVDDDGLEHLTKLADLHDLDLSNLPITDAGLRYLTKLTQLEHIRLDLTQVTDAGLDDIKGMRGLRSVNLRASKVTKSGLAELKHARPDLQLLP